MLEELATGKDQSPRNRIAAARVLVAMARANQEEERLCRGMTPAEGNVNVNITVEQVVAALQKTEEFRRVRLPAG
jgi:hypothetical protein